MLPPDDLVAELTLTAHLAPANVDRYALAGEDGAAYHDCVQRAEGHPCWPQARLLQTGSNFFRIQKRTGPDGSWVKATEGRRSDGWCQVSGPTGSITAACELAASLHLLPYALAAPGTPAPPAVRP
jgi:hypothetical protein